MYVPVKITNNLRYPYTMILQKELNAKTGAYENPKLILPPGGCDIRSGGGVSNDGAYYSAGIRGLGEPNDYGNRLLVLSDGASLNGARARSGMLQLCFCVLLSAGLLLSR